MSCLIFRILLFSKCGASTFMEILLSKKIPIITDYIWEQEKGNVDYW
jgi:processive 1,2-diacylglycerol beta-glucosyltransferase/1,2-diacylglycerol 3-beta-galactosyltransferase